MADIIMVAHDELDGLSDLNRDGTFQEKLLVFDDNLDPLLNRWRSRCYIAWTRHQVGQQQDDHAYMSTASVQLSHHIAPRWHCSKTLFCPIDNIRRLTWKIKRCQEPFHARGGRCFADRLVLMNELDRDGSYPPQQSLALLRIDQ